MPARFGVNSSSINRAAEAIQARGAAELDDIALRAAQQMEEAVADAALYEGADPGVFENVTAEIEYEDDGPRVFLQVDPDDVKALVAVFGRKGYYVRPRSAKALRFYVGGEKRFAQQVYIPPQDGYGATVLRRARDRVYQRLRRGTV